MPSPLLKTPGKFFCKSASPKMKGVAENELLYQNSIKKDEDDLWNISLLIFCMTFNFSKCYGFTVLRIISIK